MNENDLMEYYESRQTVRSDVGRMAAERIAEMSNEEYARQQQANQHRTPDAIPQGATPGNPRVIPTVTNEKPKVSHETTSGQGRASVAETAYEMTGSPEAATAGVIVDNINAATRGSLRAAYNTAALITNTFEGMKSVITGRPGYLVPEIDQYLQTEGFNGDVIYRGLANMHKALGGTSEENLPMSEALIEGGSQFMSAFMPLLKAYQSTAGGAQALQMQQGGTFISRTAARIKEGTIAGAGADFMTLYGKAEENLFNMLGQVGLEENDIIRLLSTDEHDPQIIARLKGVFAGAAIGGVADPVVGALSEGLEKGLPVMVRMMREMRADVLNRLEEEGWRLIAGTPGPRGQSGRIGVDNEAEGQHIIKNMNSEQIGGMMQVISAKIAKGMDFETFRTHLSGMGVEDADIHRLYSAGEDYLGEMGYRAKDLKRRNLKGEKPYVGSPAINSPQALGALFKRIESYVDEGAVGRMWYEESSQALLDIFGGDRFAAEQLVKAIAITSPQLDVRGNFQQALKVLNQLLTGQELRGGRFPKSNQPDLEASLRKMSAMTGRKRNAFYLNLMENINPSKVRGLVTNDMWMARAFGYPNDALTGAKYDFAERVIQDIAAKRGWEPHQVQAAVWTAMKQRYDLTRPQAINLARKRGIVNEAGQLIDKKGNPFPSDQKGGTEFNKRKAEFMDLWRDVATKHKMGPDDLADRSWSFKEFADELLAPGQISMEAVPSVTSKHMAWIHNAPYEVKQEYTYRMTNLLLDENGEDKVAKALGLNTGGMFDAPGAWMDPELGRVIYNPSKQVSIGQVAMAENMGAVRAYAAFIGKVFKQDGVGYHAPKLIDDMSKAKLIEADFGVTMPQEAFNEITEQLGKQFGPDVFTVATDQGIRVVNFSDTQTADVSDYLKNIIGPMEIDGSKGVNLHYASFDGDVVSNDWSTGNAQDFERIISDSGSSDVLRGIEDELRTKIAEIEDDLTGRFGGRQ